MEHIAETASQVRERLEALPEAPPQGPTSRSSEACPTCGGTGYVRALEGVCRCECLKRAAIHAKLSQIPERFRGASFANYVPVDGRQAAALALMSADLTKNFFLWGGYGRGKTHLAIAQYVNHVRMERPCLGFTMGELVEELRRAAMDSDYFCTVRHRARHSERFHLFVDDIDKYKTTDFRHEVLFDLVDTLYRRNLGLTVTSNCSLRELAESGAVHPSIVRRIDDMCKAVEL